MRNLLHIVGPSLILIFNLQAQGTTPAPVPSQGDTFRTQRTPTGPIELYQHYISPVDGDRCLMFPSCSAYSKEAFRRYGFIRGMLMATDRLTRCSIDLTQYKIIRIGKKDYALDPVEWDYSAQVVK